MLGVKVASCDSLNLSREASDNPASSALRQNEKTVDVFRISFYFVLLLLVMIAGCPIMLEAVSATSQTGVIHARLLSAQDIPPSPHPRSGTCTKSNTGTSPAET